MFKINTNPKNNASLNRSQMSLAVILNRLALFNGEQECAKCNAQRQNASEKRDSYLSYFLKTVDLISAKLPLINNVSKASSAEFMATLSVAT
jgi:hypothetical protein